MEIPTKIYRVSIKLFDDREAKTTIFEYDVDKITDKKIFMTHINKYDEKEKKIINKTDLGEYNINEYPTIGFIINGYTTDKEMFEKHLKLMFVKHCDEKIELYNKFKNRIME